MNISIEEHLLQYIMKIMLVNNCRIGSRQHPGACVTKT